MAKQPAMMPPTPAPEPLPSFSQVLSTLVIGQQAAIDAIAPFVEIYHAGLSLPDRPIGVFLFLGPTGTGKTRTVEAVAEALHGNPKKLVKIDCGEFQMEHEVAKLIGAPPGYLGHRETTAMLNQNKLLQATSDHSKLSVILFDEIDKAASALWRLLLGVLDKATLRLGDNSSVDFQSSLIFMTANYGARQIRDAQQKWSPFEKLAYSSGPSADLIKSIASRAAKRRFTPEFMNRVDATVTYQPLSPKELSAILDREILLLGSHIERALAERAYRLDVTKSAHAWLLEKGTSEEYGARELKRTLNRDVLLPLARMRDQIPPCAHVKITVAPGRKELNFEVN